MKLIQIASVAALIIGLAGVAFAAEMPSTSSDSSSPAVDAGNDPQGRSTEGGPDPTDVGPLGIDVGAAGTTKESRMTFFQGLSADQRSGLQTRCTAAINEGKNADVIAFCRDVMTQ